MEERNYAAVFEVTRGLRMLLHSQLSKIVSNAVVTLLPPGDTLPESSGVNLYLYKIDESSMSRNTPWPGDRRTPPGTRPALGLVLSYLLTPLGARPTESNFDTGDDAHTMLGVAMMTLHENPVVTRTHIDGFDADVVFKPYILESYENITVTLQHTSLEELSKIWSTINKPYRISVVYQVTFVELTPSAPPEAGGGIVLSTGLTVVPIMSPVITEVVPPVTAVARVPGGAITANEIELRGSAFLVEGRQPQVTVGGTRATVKSTPPPTSDRLTVVLPTVLKAGPDVDVVVTAGGRDSVPAVLTVTPWLARLQPVRTALDAALGDADRKLVLTGNGFTAPLREVLFTRAGTTASSATFDGGATDTRAVVTIPPALANGAYEVRLVLDDGPRTATNARTLQVVPLISNAAAAVVVGDLGTNVHRLTIDGARLDGTDLRVLIDGVSYSVKPASPVSPTQVVLTLGRLLDAGAHQLSVVIDGSVSRPVPLEVAP
ncbi:MAG TPA: DUF4255 domain-containing protein [Thermoanaerobaculia bacterium]|nr:DUF4255 domain-containing protein [Thermoanaerobaculia bacterium]